MTLTEQFAEMDDLLGDIPSASSSDKVAKIARYFEQCFDLDTRLRSGPSDADAAAIKDFVARTAPPVQEHAITFDSYGGEAVRVFMQQEFVGNDWVTLCMRRSHVEAFNDLYRGTVPDDDLIDTEELDEDIHSKAELEAMPKPDLMPAGVPDSHWWWALT